MRHFSWKQLVSVKRDTLSHSNWSTAVLRCARELSLWAFKFSSARERHLVLNYVDDMSSSPLALSPPKFLVIFVVERVAWLCVSATNGGQGRCFGGVFCSVTLWWWMHTLTAWPNHGELDFPHLTNINTFCGMACRWDKRCPAHLFRFPTHIPSAMAIKVDVYTYNQPYVTSPPPPNLSSLGVWYPTSLPS